MVATVSISERNGTGSGTQTDAVSNVNFGSVEQVNLDATANAITAGTNSYEKWTKFRVASGMGVGGQIDNVRVYRSAPVGSLKTGVTMHTNQDGVTPDNPSYPAGGPSQTASTADKAMPATSGTAAQISVGGSFSTALSANGEQTDYNVMQVQTTGAAVEGETTTLTWLYDEVA